MKKLAFPISVEELVPHAQPMCCVDWLLSSSKTAALAEVTLHPDHSLLHEGMLDAASFVELAAQTASAMQGYDRIIQGLEPAMGFLVGVQDFAILGQAFVGDTLHLAVNVAAELGPVSVIAAGVTRGETLLATGNLKVYVAE